MTHAEFRARVCKEDLVGYLKRRGIKVPRRSEENWKEKCEEVVRMMHSDENIWATYWEIISIVLKDELREGKKASAKND